MTTPELLAFIRNDLSLGNNRETISSKLKSQGWTDEDINEAFTIIGGAALSVARESEVPKAEEKPHTIISPMHPEIPIETFNSMSSIKPISTMADYKPTSTGKKKVLNLVLFIVIPTILVLGGLVAYASGFLFNPKTLATKILDSSGKSTSASYDMKMVVDASDLKAKSNIPTNDILDKYRVFNFELKGSSDSLSKDNLKLDNTLSFSSGDIEATLKMIVVDNSIYLNLMEAPTISFFSLKPFEDKWVVIPLKDKDGVDDTMSNPMLASLPISGASLVTDLTDEQKKQLGEMAKKASFIKITKKHLPEMMDGTLVYHFDYDLDREGIVSFLKEMSTFMKDINKDFASVAPENDSDYSKIFDQLKNFKGEVWIGVMDNLPRKITANMEINSFGDSVEGVTKASITMVYSNWNKPLKVQAPTSAVSIEEFIKTIFGGIFKQPEQGITNSNDNTITFDMSDPLYLDAARTKGKDASIKSILSSMRASAEIYYDSHNMSYKGYCRDKSEFGAYQAAIKLPKGTDYKCNDLANAWAAWSKLNSDGYYCVDSTGFAVDVKMIPSGTSCPK